MGRGLLRGQFCGVKNTQHRLVVLERDSLIKGLKLIVAEPKGFGQARKQVQFYGVRLSVRQHGVAHIGQDAQLVGGVQHVPGVGDELLHRHGLHIIDRAAQQIGVFANDGLQLVDFGFFHFAVGQHHVQQGGGQHQRGRKLYVYSSSRIQGCNRHFELFKNCGGGRYSGHDCTITILGRLANYMFVIAKDMIILSSKAQKNNGFDTKKCLKMQRRRQSQCRSVMV